MSVITKQAEYFYNGIHNKELIWQIEGLLRDLNIEVFSLGIKNLDDKDIKYLIAHVDSLIERSKAVQMISMFIGFGLSFLIMVFKELITDDQKFAIIYITINVITLFGFFKLQDVRFRNEIQKLSKLSKLLTLYIEDRKKNKEGSI